MDETDSELFETPSFEEEEEYSDDESFEEWAIYQLKEADDDEHVVPTAADGEVLKPGHHVYMWCNVYTHHGIILDTSKYGGKCESIKDSNEKEANDYILIVEFTNVALEESTFRLNSMSTASEAVSAQGVAGGLRVVREYNPSQWNIVRYGANPLECLTNWAPGTCSGAKPAESAIILSRVLFLLEFRHILPDYHVLASNCETVAVWCTTGEWKTLQGNRALQLSQLGALALLPVGGLGLAGLAASTLAVGNSRHINQRWEDTGERLNRQLGWYLMGRMPDLNFEELLSQ